MEQKNSSKTISSFVAKKNQDQVMRSLFRKIFTLYQLLIFLSFIHFYVTINYDIIVFFFLDDYCPKIEFSIKTQYPSKDVSETKGYFHQDLKFDKPNMR